MKKLLLGLVCCLLVVGVANMGHASIFGLFGGSSGGGKRQPAGQSTLNLGSLFNHDFHQFGVKPETGGHGQGNSESGALQYYGNLPDLDSNHDGRNRGDGGLNFNDFDSGSNYYGRNDGPGNPANSPVPEPATMILLGIGLIGLAGFGRRKFTK